MSVRIGYANPEEVFGPGRYARLHERFFVDRAAGLKFVDAMKAKGGHVEYFVEEPEARTPVLQKIAAVAPETLVVLPTQISGDFSKELRIGAPQIAPSPAVKPVVKIDLSRGGGIMTTVVDPKRKRGTAGTDRRAVPRAGPDPRMKPAEKKILARPEDERRSGTPGASLLVQVKESWATPGGKALFLLLGAAAVYALWRRYRK